MKCSHLTSFPSLWFVVWSAKPKLTMGFAPFLSKLILFLVFLPVSFSSLSQTYILNEDFSSAFGSLPPGQWTSTSLNSVLSDVWKFDNPGNQSLNFPIIGQFAIFDAQHYSNNNQPEESILESPVFDASIGSTIYLFFDHTFSGSGGDSGFVELFNGTSWVVVQSYISPTTNPNLEVINVSSIIGGVSNAKLRFRWIGNGSNFWAVDNISVFVPAVVDAGILAMSAPLMPFSEGIQAIKIDIRNFGASTLSNLNIAWSVNNQMQIPSLWTGSLAFTDTLSDYAIGSYSFVAGQPISLKVWLSSINGGLDANPLNDTIEIVLTAGLCGTYTIGGLAPDFPSFTEAASALNNAGITCPVLFLVRDGMYAEQMQIHPVWGCDSLNTVTFRGESLDSSLVTLSNVNPTTVLNYAMHIAGASWLNFEHLGFEGASSGINIHLQAGASNIQFSHCRIVRGNQQIRIESGSERLVVEHSSFHHVYWYDYHALVVDGNSPNSAYTGNITINNNIFHNFRNNGVLLVNASDVSLIQNTFIGGENYHGSLQLGASRNILIEDNTWQNLNRAFYANNSDSITLQNNSFQNLGVYGISIHGSSNLFLVKGNEVNGVEGSGVSIHGNHPNMEVSYNRILNIYNHDAFTLDASNVKVYNNYVHSYGVTNHKTVFITSNASLGEFIFNSVHTTNTNPLGLALEIQTPGNLSLRNNIIANTGQGLAMRIPSLPTGLVMDYNAYYTDGFSLLSASGVNYLQLSDWQLNSGLDTNSYEANPFFLSDTDLSCNQILFNDNALFQSSILFDIDSTSRGLSPDIGAKEFSPCLMDAGINSIIGLSANLPAGLMNIEVVLINQASGMLNSCTIEWSVNGIAQTSFLWTGSLSSANQDTVAIGSYNFVTGNNFEIMVWTSNPNGLADCNVYNDTTTVGGLSTPLCGTYTIGGLSPDFDNFAQAVNILNNAGISCSVLFLVRDGTYEEQIEIDPIPGTGFGATVTFRGESLDSSLVSLSAQAGNPYINYTLKLNGASWLRFEHIGFVRSTYQINVQVSNQAANLIFTHCRFLRGSDQLRLEAGCHHIEVSESAFIREQWGDYRGLLVIGNSSDITQTHSINIRDNTFSNFNFSGCYLEHAYQVELYGNSFMGGENRDGAIWINNIRDIEVEENSLKNLNRGIRTHACDSIRIINNELRNLGNLDGNQVGYGVSVGGNPGIYIFEANILDSIVGPGLSISGNPLQMQVSQNRITRIRNYDAMLIDATNVELINNFVHTEGEAVVRGVVLAANAHKAKLIYNSVYNTSSHPESLALEIIPADSLLLENNIFANQSVGLAFRTMPLSPIFSANYNAYHSSGFHLFSYNDTLYSHLNEWQTISSLDSNSVQANPFFTSTTNLTCNQILINDQGLVQGLVPVDIDSTLRSASPDIGAREFTPCGLDAGINAIVGLSNPLSIGMQSFEVVLVNQGLLNLQSCYIEWMVNGVLQTGIHWAGNLASGDSDTLLLGPFNFLSGENFEISAWTTIPNNGIDCNYYNDTSSIWQLATPLCGTYTIGGSNPDFENFTQAANALNHGGILCSVLFLVRDGVYQEQITLHPVQGSDSLNTITFRGESLDSSLVSLSNPNGGLLLDYTFWFKGSSWISVEHIGIQRATNRRNIFLSHKASNISFSHCRIIGGSEQLRMEPECHSLTVQRSSLSSTNQGDYRGIVVQGIGGNPGLTHTCRILNNSFSNYSYTSSSFNGVSKVEISDNIFAGGQNYNGTIHLEGVVDAEIKNNTMSNQNRSMTISNSDSILIENNDLQNIGVHGIYVSGSSSWFRITENRLDNIHGVGLNLLGIHVDFEVSQNRIINIHNNHGLSLDAHHVKIFNNFIHTSGSSSSPSVFFSPTTHHVMFAFNSVNNVSSNVEGVAFEMHNHYNLTIKNNIFANSGSGLAIRTGLFGSNTILDYNNYYSNSGSFGKFNSIVFQNLNNWKAATLQDPNSFTYNPFFVSPAELRPNQRELNGAGVPMSSVLLDIDGEIRDENSPDIGADEFMVDFGILDLLEPTLHCFLTTNDSVKVLLKQFGDIPFLNMQLAYQVNNGPVFYGNVPGALDNDIVFTFPQTQNLASYGEYVFKVWIVNSFDDNLNNDTLIVHRYSHPIPDLHFQYTSGCANSQTDFSATATVISGNMDYYLWHFGDGNSEQGQALTHVYDTSGVYTVHLFAYVEEGCYKDTLFDVEVLTTPFSDFQSNHVCLGDTMVFINLSSVSSGSMSYLWQFGDGSSSILESPSHVFSADGYYPIGLISTAVNGCSDTLVQYYSVFALPDLQFLGLPYKVCLNDDPFLVSVNPAGGTLSGNAMNALFFYPSQASIGYENLNYLFTDNNACTNLLIDSVEVLSIPEVSVVDITDVDCFGNASGSISLTVTGGTSPAVSLLWNDGASGLNNGGLAVGNYSVTISDLNLCSTSETYFVDQPLAPLDLAGVTQNILCFGDSTGSIQVSAFGGTTPYISYNWSNGMTGTLITDLSYGPYAVTVTDNNACIDTVSFFIFEGSPMNISFSVVDLICPDIPIGQVQTTVSGATPPYVNFTWSNGGSTQNIIGLDVGIYVLTITDGNNCVFTSTATVEGPSDWSLSFTGNSLLCHGDTNGVVEVLAGGANPPYLDYLWSNGATGTSITNVGAGFYNITVLDSKNCQFQGTFELQEPPLLQLDFDAKNPLCYGDLTGEIDLSITGGTMPYGTIIWSNSIQAEDISDLLAGDYQVTVFDANNCRSTGSVKITEPEEISIAESTAEVNCFGEATGSIELLVEGGISPYQFAWSNSMSTVFVDGLEAGNYSVSVEDFNACLKTKAITIESNPEISAGAHLIHPSCIFAENGSIMLSTQGGVSPYTFDWSNGESGDSITDLPPGIYEVLVYDSLSCEKSFTFFIDFNESPCISPPSLLSPNGDGINDRWIIDGIEYTPDCKVSVLNRWGQTVFESIGYHTPWDGKFEGKSVPSDGYFWLIDFNNGHPPLSGKLTVIY